MMDKECKNINKIVISGGWAYGNIGDEAILKYTYDDIKQRYNDIPILLLSNSIEVTKKHHNIDAEKCLYRILDDQYIIPFQFYNDSKKIMKEIELDKKITNREVAEYAELFDENTLFFMAGGGYFNDIWLKSFYAHILEVAIAKSRGAKVVIISQTIGPISAKKNREIVKKYFGLVDCIYVRDIESKRLIEEIVPGKEVLLSADAANRVGKNKNIYTKAERERITIGVMYQQLRPYTTKNSSAKLYRIKELINKISGKNKAYNRKCISILNQISSTFPDCNIAFILSTEWNVDRIEELKSDLNSSNVEIYSKCTVDELISRIDMCNLMITANMHPAIIATSLQIPIIVFSHTYKIDNFVESISQEDCLFRMDAFDEKKVYEKAYELLTTDRSQALYESNRKLQKMLDDMYNEINKNF